MSTNEEDDLQSLTRNILVRLRHPLRECRPTIGQSRIRLIFSIRLTCLRTKLNKLPLSSLSRSYFALIRKCIKAGEPRDKPATTGPNPISLSL